MSIYQVDISTMSITSPRDFAAYTAGFEQGYVEGIDRGIGLAKEAEQQAWEPMREHTAKLAARQSYETVCLKRGEPERAARQRQILTEKGLA